MDTKITRITIGLIILTLAGCSKHANTSAESTDASRTQSLAVNTPSVATTTVAGHQADKPATYSTPTSAENAPISQEGTVQTNPPRTTRYLPSESKFIIGDALSLEVMRTTLQDRNFSRHVQSFARDSSADPNAQDLTNLYKDEIGKLTKDAQLSEFACGLSVCIGAIRSTNKVALNAWSEAFSQSPTTPNYSFAERVVPLGNNDFETRFIFSMDPAANSVSGPIRH